MKQLHSVYMHADFEITLPQPLDLVTHPENIEVGGFEVVVNGLVIPFDFDVTAVVAKKNSDIGHTEYSCHYESEEYPYISDCYSDEYNQLGLSREDITAKFLASASELRDFYVVCWDENGKEVHPSSVKVSRVCFMDEDLHSFLISNRVLNAFNTLQKEI